MSVRIIPQALRKAAFITIRHNPTAYGVIARQPRNLHFTRSPPALNLRLSQWTGQRMLTTSTKPNGSATTAIHNTAVIQEKKPGKLRQLMKQYGIPGIAVYLTLGMVDLGATYFTIQMVGAEKVKELENWVKSSFGRFGVWNKKNHDEPDTTATTLGVGGVLGELEAEVTAEGAKPSVASIFILAYGIHKTVFLPFRLGVTAAITPWVVRRLGAMGWIGRKAL
jgi:Protein of unknown function (DUF1279)